jgi:hypothetical protein
MREGRGSFLKKKKVAVDKGRENLRKLCGVFLYKVRCGWAHHTTKSRGGDIIVDANISRLE